MKKHSFKKFLAISTIVLAGASLTGTAQGQTHTMPSYDLCTPALQEPPYGWTAETGLCYDEFEQIMLYLENGGQIDVQVDSAGFVNNATIRAGYANPDFVGLVAHGVSRCIANAGCRKVITKIAEGVFWWGAGNCANNYLANGRCN